MLPNWKNVENHLVSIATWWNSYKPNLKPFEVNLSLPIHFNGFEPGTQGGIFKKAIYGPNSAPTEGNGSFT